MAIFKSQSSDTSSVFRARGTMYKSLRDTPSFQEKGYRFAYNLGTVSALTGAKTGGVRSKLYDSLDARNTMRSLTNKQVGTSRSLARRGLYKFAARGAGMAMNSFLPTGTGLIGRYLRVVGGRTSSRALRAFDTKVKGMLYGDFRLDAKKIDKYVQNPTSQVGIDFRKIQLAMQAIAIANAPDPYAVNKYNRQRGQMELGDEKDGVLSSFSLQTMPDETIESLMSRKDIVEIMGQNAVRGGYGLDRMTINSPINSFRNGRINESLYVTNSRGLGNDIKSNAFSREGKRDSLDYLQELRNDDFIKDLSEGVVYGFGSPINTSESGVIAEFAANILATADRYGENIEGATTSDNMKMIVATKIQEIRMRLGDQAINELGKMTGVLRYIHGDDNEIANQGKSYKTISNRTLNIYDKNNPRTISQDKLVYDKVQQYDVEAKTVTEITTDPSIDREIRNEIRKLGYIPPELASIQQGTLKRVETRKKRVPRVETVQKSIPSKVGSLKYQKQQIQMLNESLINRENYLEQNFSDNTQRHNYVSNRRQIQSAIHAMDPDYSDAKATVIYAVGFGGKTKKDKKANAIRDAYQIEYGGPATDKNKVLTNRTDAFVYTPSLFMYRSAVGAATKFGLGVSSGRSIAGHVVGGMSNLKIPGSTSNTDVFLKTRGMSAPNAKQKKILDEIYEKSVKQNNNPVMKNGQVLLNKNKVLRSAYESSTLDLLSETLDDTIFGGADVMRRINKTSFGGRRGFESVIDDDVMNYDRQINRFMKEAGIYKQGIPSTQRGNEIFVGMEFKPDVNLDTRIFDVEEVLDEGGKVVGQKITRYRFETDEFPQDADGKAFLVGNSINRYTRKNVTSYDSFDMSQTGVAEDLEILKDMDMLRQKFGKDIRPGDPEFLTVNLRSITNRQLQAEQFTNEIKDELRRTLSSNMGFSNKEINDFTDRLANKIIKDLEGEAQIGGILITPQAVQVIKESTDQALKNIEAVIKRTGPYPFNYTQGKRGRKIVDDGRPGVDKITVTYEGQGDRDKALLDASITARGIGMFLLDSDLEDVVVPSNMKEVITQLNSGQIDSAQAAAKLARKGKAQTSIFVRDNIINTEGNPLPTPKVFEKKRNRIPRGTTMASYGKSGAGNYNFETNNVNIIGSDKDIATKARADVNKFQLNKGSLSKQIAYVESELKRIEQSRDINNSKRDMILKASSRPEIKEAFYQYMQRDTLPKKLGLNGRDLNVLRQFLDVKFPTGNIRFKDDTFDDPDQFDDGDS